MKLSQLGEFGLIDRIARREHKLGGTVVGIGDDAAVISSSVNSRRSSVNYQLITTDTLIENVHFRSKGTSFFALGYKALAVNISDIAAMGGWPTHALVTVGFPKSMDVRSIDEIYRGINALARKHKIDIIGGDTVASPREIIISITLLGEVEKECLLLRSTARVGDVICATGKFGGPAATKFKIQSKKFKTNVNEGRKIARSGLATSMIDSSDGLVRSVLEICRASKVGAKIYENKVPIARGAALDQALYGGEEYELVFTASLKDVPVFKKLNVSIVGKIETKGKGVKLVDPNGNIKPLKSGGYEHFK